MSRNPAYLPYFGFLIVWLAACSDPTPNHADTKSNVLPRDSITRQPEPQPKPDNQGSATYRDDPSIDAQHLGIPLYPNAQILKSGTWDLRNPDQGTEALTALKMTSNDAIGKVTAFYRQKLTDAQIIEIDRAGSKRVSITVTLPDQTATNAVLRETASGTSIEITRLGSSRKTEVAPNDG